MVGLKKYLLLNTLIDHDELMVFQILSQIKYGLNLLDLVYLFCRKFLGIQKKRIPLITNMTKLKMQLSHWYLVFLSASSSFCISTDSVVVVVEEEVVVLIFAC